MSLDGIDLWPCLGIIDTIEPSEGKRSDVVYSKPFSQESRNLAQM